MVMGKGNFTLDDGTQIEAGRFNTNKTGSFGEFNFSQGFQDAPVVLAGVTSFNETKHRKYSIQLVDANRDLTYRAAKLKTIYHIAVPDYLPDQARSDRCIGGHYRSWSCRR